MAAIPFKKYLYWAGRILGLAGVVWVAVKLSAYRDQLAFSGLGWRAWTALSLLALVYGLSGILLALAWRDLLRDCGAAVDRRWAIASYGVSQVAKYVPGNIFHLLSRQALGAVAGIPAMLLARSSVWELGMLCLSACLFVLLCVPLLLPDVPQVVTIALFVSAVFACTGIAVRRSRVPLARTIVWHTTFFFLSGTIFVAVLLIVTSVTSVTSAPLRLAPVAPVAPIIIGAYVIAWLAGFAAPGAPAGLGVREAVLLGLLGPLVDPPDLLVAVLLARGVAVVGDGLFYLAASGLEFGTADAPASKANE